LGNLMRVEEISPAVPGAFLIEVDGRMRLATLSGDATAVYGERILEGMRLWDPHRSKLAALLLKSGGSGLALPSDARVLYLGAATGTTVSHVSDLVSEGLVYAVEFSPRAMRDLVRLCQRRKNIIPILADAARPEDYASLLEPVDLIYQDVAQRNQAEIASANSHRYLRPGGDLLLMLKSRSVDVTAAPQAVLDDQANKLAGLDIRSICDLLPFHQDHWAIIAKKL